MDELAGTVFYGDLLMGHLVNDNEMTDGAVDGVYTPPLPNGAWRGEFHRDANVRLRTRGWAGTYTLAQYA